MKDKRLYARHAKVKRGAQLHKMQWKKEGWRPGSGKANSNTMRRVSKFSTNKSRIMSIVKPSIINDQRSTKILLLPVSRECGTTGERNDHSSFIAHKSGAVVREINTSIMISIVDYYVALFAAFVVPRF